jgi:ABC-type Co2+ transport system permease subunit
MNRKRVLHRKSGFLRHHTLSLATVGILLSWIVLYVYGDPKTHWGSFFGNAIADWTGVVVTVITTKYLVVGS